MVSRNRRYSVKMVKKELEALKTVKSITVCNWSSLCVHRSEVRGYDIADEEYKKIGNS